MRPESTTDTSIANVAFYAKDPVTTILENGSTEEIVEFAKKFNLFLENKGQAYVRRSQLLKDRLDKENIDWRSWNE